MSIASIFKKDQDGQAGVSRQRNARSNASSNQLKGKSNSQLLAPKDKQEDWRKLMEQRAHFLKNI